LARLTTPHLSCAGSVEGGPGGTVCSVPAWALLFRFALDA